MSDWQYVMCPACKCDSYAVRFDEDSATTEVRCRSCNAVLIRAEIRPPESPRRRQVQPI